MKAGVWTGHGQLVFQDWPDPDVAEDGVLVKVAYSGMCGSDAHVIEGDLPTGPPPQVLGHEVSGTVAAVGSQVTGLEVGSRVACNFFSPCGRCPWCADAQPNHCRRKTLGASGYAEYAAYRADQVFVLPDAVPLDEGALLEPAATALYAVEQSGLRPGETVLVIGAGPIGLLTAQIARLMGAGAVVVSEPNPAKRALAKQLGFTRVLDPIHDELHPVSRSVSPRRGFDVVYDSAGVASVAAEATNLLATRGRLMLLAVYGSDVTIPINPRLFYERELVVRSTFATAYAFPRTVALLPQLQLKPLITAVEPLSSISDVYQRHRAGQYTKVLLEP